MDGRQPPACSVALHPAALWRSTMLLCGAPPCCSVALHPAAATVGVEEESTQTHDFTHQTPGPYFLDLANLQARLQEVLLELLPPKALVVLVVVCRLLLGGDLRVLLGLQRGAAAPHAHAAPETPDEVVVAELGGLAPDAVGLLDLVRQNVVHPPPAVREEWAQPWIQRGALIRNTNPDDDNVDVKSYDGLVVPAVGVDEVRTRGLLLASDWQVVGPPHRVGQLPLLAA
ncbi:hypothetical protein EYF80_037428 [Liparis tanakae]|uniref:Uncharacterized protein n=1 Tax=Liparis tanakae TaxID=230148 RepID=A0A4Z2GGT6_9TELE|nr:hypothetical protein EYF80_037428 [Liparis tanakae]